MITIELNVSGAVVERNDTAEEAPKSVDSLVEEKVKVDFTYKEKPVYDFIKRVFDIFCSVLALIVLCPFCIIISVVIMIHDRNLKPFFIQNRCGRNGKQFKFYKFRTMCVDAESKLEQLQEKNEMDGPVFKITEDPRITKIGKVLRAAGIDELPQLWNILKGDMSFVGPRPPLPKEVEQYSDTDRLRLLVKPGLNCYWQVQPNRNSISFEKWMELDRKYIQQRSFWVDIKLILKTAVSVFKREGC